MENEDGRPNEPTAGPLTASEDLPPLLISRDRLTFYAGGKAVHVPLDKLVEAGNTAAVPLLLYGLILKVNDLDLAFRELLRMASEQQARSEFLQGGGAQQAIADVVKGLRDMGIFPPPVGPATKAGASVQAGAPGNSGSAEEAS